MHSYSTNSKERIYFPFFIAILSIFAAWLLHIILSEIEFSSLNLWWLEIPSVWGFYFILFFFFDKYLWKIKLLFLVKLINIPDLNGNWEGITKSSRDDFESEYPVSVSIMQTWSKIVIIMKAEDSKSKSEICGLFIDSKKNVAITYQYLNEPNIDAVDTMHPHRGTSRLVMAHDNNNVLTGDYYSGRGRQNLGKIYLEKKQLEK